MVLRVITEALPMKTPFYVLKAGYAGLITHIRNYLSLYFPNIFSSRPVAIDIYPTFKCNLQCTHCNCWKMQSKDGELPIDKWKEIIINLRKWLGPFCLRICGAEPLMWGDLIDIIKFSHQLGIVTTLTTNGTLIDENFAGSIVKSGLDLICISLDSLKEKVYEYLRGVKGTYRKTMQAIKYLQGRIKNIQINTTIMGYNLDEIMDLVKFCDDNELLISFQGLYGLWDIKTGFYYPPANDLWPQDKSKIRYIFDEILLKKRKGRNIKNSITHLQILKSYYLELRSFVYNKNFYCLAHQRNFRIRFNGVATFCHHSGSIGNVTTTQPQKIWKSKEAFRVREKMKNCHRDCSYIRSHYYEGLLEKIVKFKNTFFN